VPKKVADKVGQDPTLPDVELVVAGKRFKLAFDFNAICVAEKETGVNLLTSIVEEITANSLRGLLFAALLKDQPEMTIEHAGALITPTNMGAVRTAVVTAWFGSIESADEGKD
jgi:hypothetical protein